MSASDFGIKWDPIRDNAPQSPAPTEVSEEESMRLDDEFNQFLDAMTPEQYEHWYHHGLEGIKGLRLPKPDRLTLLQKAYPKARRYLRQNNPRGEFVYCIRAISEFDHCMYKFGKAKDVMSRIRQLQTGQPFKLDLVFYTDFFEEKYFHEWLSEYRERGEWFRLWVTPSQLAEAYEQFLLFDANLPRHERLTVLNYIRNRSYEAGLDDGNK